MLELCIINAMVLYFSTNPAFSKNRQAHKLFRTQLVHELVQPLLDKRTDPNEDQSPTPGRKRNLDDIRLKGKHFSETPHPKWGRCSVCAYKKGKNNRYKDTKTSNFCPKCQNSFAKAVLKHFTPKASHN